MKALSILRRLGFRWTLRRFSACTFLLAVIGAVLLPALFATAFGATAASDEPLFARNAVWTYGGKPAVSPDGKKRVTTATVANDSIEGFPTTIALHVGSRTFTAHIESGLGAEVLWSPDSRAFAITGSREGSNGNYYADVFVVNASGLVKIPLTRLIRLAFGHPVKCAWPEYPNIGAFGWLDGSKYLLVAAQIINHSNCDSFGTFKTYQVDIAQRRVVRVLDQIETKRQFGHLLGPWLADAPDACVRTPSACFVSTNHPEPQRH